MIIVGYLEYLEVEFNNQTLRQSFSAEGLKPSQIDQVTVFEIIILLCFSNILFCN